MEARALERFLSNCLHSSGQKLPPQQIAFGLAICNYFGS